MLAQRKAPRDLRAPKVFPELLVPLDRKVLPAYPDLLVLLVPLDLLEQLEQSALSARLDQLALPDLLGLRVPRVLLDPQDPLEQPDLPDQSVLPDLLDPLDPLEQSGLSVLLA